MHIPGVVQILGGKRTLQAAQAHPETHGIQINEAIIRLVGLPDLFQVGILVNKQGDSDVDSVSSSESDVFSECGEARMRGDMVV